MDQKAFSGQLLSKSLYRNERSSNKFVASSCIVESLEFSLKKLATM